AGASKMRLTTTSRSDLRSAEVGCLAPAGSLLSTIVSVLAFQFVDDLVQRIEARRPHAAVALKPGPPPLPPAPAHAAGAHAPCLLGCDQTSLLQHADVLLHARQRHLEALGQLCDRGVLAPELLDHAAPGRVGQRGEGDVKTGWILNHKVQYRVDHRW